MKKDTDGTPKALIHYTEGGPWFENYRHCEFNMDLWKHRTSGHDE